MIVSNKNYKNKNFFIFTKLLLALAILTFGSWLCFFNIITNSDVFIEEIWSRALLNRGFSAWYDLLFTFAPSYFPDFLGYFLAKLFFSTNVILTVYLATLFQIGMLLLSIYAVLYILGRKGIQYVTWAILLVAFLTLMAAHYPGLWLWYYSGNDNLSATILGFFSLALLLAYFNKPGYIKLIFLFIVASFSILNGKLFLITFLAPAIFFLMALMVLSRINKHFFCHASIIVKPLGALVASYPFSEYFLTPLINPYSTADAKMASGIGFKHSFINFIHAYKNLFSTNDILLTGISIIWTVLFLISFWMTLLLLKERFGQKDEINIGLSKNILFFYLFAFFALIVNFWSPIFVGQILNLASFRYFSTLIILPFLVALIGVTQQDFFFKNVLSIGKINTGFAIICIILSILVYQDDRRSINQVLQKEPSTREAILANCLDKYNEKYPLHLGVSDYWDSYSVSLLNHKGIWINPVDNLLEPAVALDRGIYFDPLGKEGNKAKYNFILITNNKHFEFTERAILKVAPKPDIILTCPSLEKIYLYTRTSEKLNRMLQERWENFLFLYGKGSHSKIIVRPHQWIPLREELNNVSSPNLGPSSPTGWVFGSVRKPIKPGFYREKITLTASSNKITNKPIVAVGFSDVTTSFNPATGDVGAEGMIIGSSQKHQVFQKVIFISRKASKHPWGFWIYNYGGGKVLIHKVELERIR